MDLGSLRLLARDASMSVMGVDATVTVPGGVAVEARAVWVQPLSELGPGNDLSRRNTRRVLMFSRSVVSDVPRGSEIVAAEYEGAPVYTWIADGIDRMDADEVRVIVTKAL